MNPERWREVEAIYHAALERPEAERPAFLRDACRGNHDLLREVESLLGFDEKGARLMQQPAAMSAARPALSPGTRLGVYEVVGFLGAGGMGEVYRARDTQLQREVAIKILPDELASNRERLARFEREARLLASLSHPNIAGIHGLELVAPDRYLVLELVVGETLAAHLAQGALPIPEALHVCAQVAAAIESAHEAGVVHRDLKPGNVMLTAAGVVKVLDFGLATDAAAYGSPSDHSPSPTLTRSGMILGTAPYMSPEQARGRPLDRRSDIWSFGCVLFECLTGRAAFGAETPSDAIARVLQSEPDWDALPPLTPPRVRELLHRCLEKDPRQRLRDIGDARIFFDEALARSPSGTAIVAEAEPTPGTGRLSQRLSTIVAGVAVVAALTSAGVLWRIQGRGDPGRATPETAFLSVELPPDVVAEESLITPDGRTVVVRGRLRVPAGSEEQRLRLYARPLDRYLFQPLPGTEGAVRTQASRDGRRVMFWSVPSGSTALRWSTIPVDGSAPATEVAPWNPAWSGVVELESGDFLVRSSQTSFFRLGRDRQPSAPVEIDAGRPNVSRYGFTGEVLPGDRVLVDVVTFVERSFQFHVGVMDPESGRVKVIEEDGGSAVWSPPGHVVFARSGEVLALPFDLDRLEPRGPATAVWSGLMTPRTRRPAEFQLTRTGALYYRPGQSTGARPLAIVAPPAPESLWLRETMDLEYPPIVSPDGGRVALTIVNGRGLNEVFISALEPPSLLRIAAEHAAECAFLAWSPDGRRFAYTRRGGDDRDGLYVRDVEGGQSALVLPLRPDQIMAPPGGSWAPDGRALVLSWGWEGKEQIVRVSLDEGESDTEPVRTLLSGASPIYNVRLSPGGDRVAFLSRESGRFQPYVAELRPDGSLGPALWARTSGASSWLQWTPDGGALLVQSGRKVVRIPVGRGPSIGAPAEVLDLDAEDVELWAALPDGRYFVGLRNENEKPLDRYHIVLGLVRRLGVETSAP